MQAIATRHEDHIDEQHLGRLVHSHVEHLDTDEEYAFHLRGHSLNPLVDAASALLGMVVRVRQLGNLEDIERLYQQVVDEIISIELELTEQGYDRPTLLAYRYVLCSFIDEAVMGTTWGQQSHWAGHSLLARFHNETWGGEKVFSILSRLQQEPQRFHDMLAFIYLCLCLGFEGRYKVLPQRRDEYEQILRAASDQLIVLSRESDTHSEEPLTAPLDNVVRTPQRRDQGLPMWAMFGVFTTAMTLIYGALAWSLDRKADEIITLLDQIL